MSKAAALKLLAFLGGLGFVGFVVATWFVRTDDLPSWKDEHLQPQPSYPERHTAKVRGPLRVHLERDDGSTILAPGEVAELVGTVTSTDHLSNVEFKWALDPEIEVISGSLKGVLPSLSPGQNQIIKIVIRHHSSSRKLVHLSVAFDRGGVILRQVAQWGTSPEEKDFIIEPTSAQSNTD